MGSRTREDNGTRPNENQTLCHLPLALPPSTRSDTQTTHPPMPSRLQTFPYEVLSEIFTVAEIFPQAPCHSAVVLSHVCRQWREAAVGDSALWLEIGLCSRDVRHISVITQFLLRSKGRKIGVEMDFGDLQNLPENPAMFYQLLRLIRAHLWRVCHLFIYARWQTWQMIIPAFGNQAYPNLSLLDVELVVPPTRSRPRALRIPGNAVSGPVAVRAPPLPPVTFPIPHQHPLLNRLRLSGLSLANVPLPNLALIRISGNSTPNLVGPDGRLNRWMLDGPKSLYFEDMQVPPMRAYVPQPMAERKISTITHLILSGLTATPRPGGVPGPDGHLEHSCIPFFDSLYAPRVRCLQIDRWNLKGRVWRDFFNWLPENIRFPCIVDLRITGMHFKDMDYAGIAFFLGSFPRTRHLRLENCWPGTWEAALEVLQMDETLCPGIKGIRLGENDVVFRNDPLPFAREDLDGGI